MAQTDLLRKSYSVDHNPILCMGTWLTPSGHGWIFQTFVNLETLLYKFKIFLYDLLIQS